MLPGFLFAAEMTALASFVAQGGGGDDVRGLTTVK
jgi:hypothetical protein